jgi:glycosyltransferase involved in cell wall biosynthesis
VRIVYYTHPAFFEPALCLVKELSRHVHMHLLLELSPGAWQTAGFDLDSRPLPTGLIPADEVLKGAVPAGVRAYWQSVASFHLVVHPSRRSVHPASWNVSRRVLRFTAECGGDVLHIDDVDVSPRLALALPTVRRPPVLITVHDPEPHSGERNWRKRLARRLAYPKASRFLLYNAAFREDFTRRYRIAPASIQVARLGVYDILREWPSQPADGTAPTVLFFGRLSAYKGLDVFYDAVRLIAQRVAGVKFVVAGRPVPGYTPPLPPSLRSSGSIDVVDRYLSNTDAARLFRSASVVVCPYRDATQSGVVLSAFAFGVPVVATAVGGLPEYVIPERTGLLVPVGDPRAVADAVCRILLDMRLAAQLRSGIAMAAEGALSWHDTANALVRTYSDLSGSS